MTVLRLEILKECQFFGNASGFTPKLVEFREEKAYNDSVRVAFSCRKQVDLKLESTVIDSSFLFPSARTEILDRLV